MCPTGTGHGSTPTDVVGVLPSAAPGGWCRPPAGAPARTRPESAPTAPARRVGTRRRAHRVGVVALVLFSAVWLGALQLRCWYAGPVRPEGARVAVVAERTPGFTAAAPAPGRCPDDGARWWVLDGPAPVCE